MNKELKIKISEYENQKKDRCYWRINHLPDSLREDDKFDFGSYAIRKEGNEYFLFLYPADN